MKQSLSTALLSLFVIATAGNRDVAQAADKWPNAWRPPFSG
jgi:hypothetical protein